MLEKVKYSVVPHNPSSALLSVLFSKEKHMKASSQTDKSWEADLHPDRDFLTVKMTKTGEDELADENFQCME